MFSWRVGGVYFVKRISTLGLVGMLCDWISCGSFITTTCHGLVAFFARAKHFGIRAWIRNRDRDEVAALASQHVDGGGHDLCVVVGGELDLGIHLEHPRNLA